MRALQLGISGIGVLHTDDRVPTVEEKFRMVSEAGVFDYYDRTPTRAELAAHQNASAKFALPIRSSGFFYMLGRDEALLEDNLKIAKECGTELHNVQIFTCHADGHVLSNEEIAEGYLRIAELGDRYGVTPCFENHINMWSEHCGRVVEVARLVEARGGRFNMTMDHSHVVFKMENPKELAVQDLQRDVDAGRVILDPEKPGNVAKQWIDSNYVVIAHARPVVPNNPENIWGKHPDGRVGRGVQYPWIKPAAGEWHSEWREAKLAPWKRTMRDLLFHHASQSHSRLKCITLEMIPPPDYGAGAKYSIFNNNIACAKWIRQTWDEVLAEVGTPSSIKPALA